MQNPSSQITTSNQFSSIRVDPVTRMELIDDSHAEKLFKLITNNKDHLSVWLPWVAYMQSIENIREYIFQCKQQLKEGTDYGYVIKIEDIIVGRIGIHGIHPQNKSGAIGYWLGKEHEGKGIITRACEALMNHCYKTLQLNRIEIKCGTGNSKSAAIPKRLGFTKEGVLRQSEWLENGFIDLAVYSMLKEEWTAKF